MLGPAVTAATTDDQLARLVDSFAPDPLDVLKGHTLQDFIAACQAEQPGLPDPYIEDPEPRFRWEADSTNKEVWIRPRTTAVHDEFVTKSCEEYLGLNREELRRWRWKLAYEHLIHLKGILEQLEHQGIHGHARTITTTAIRNMMSADQPYAGMVRYFVKNEWALGV